MLTHLTVKKNSDSIDLARLLAADVVNNATATPGFDLDADDLMDTTLSMITIDCTRILTQSEVLELLDIDEGQVVHFESKEGDARIVTL